MPYRPLTSDLKSFAEHILHKLPNAAAIAPFVVIPTDELEKPLVEFDPRARVKNRRSLGMDEVAADHFVLGIFQDALQIGLARLFHRRADLGVAGVPRGL